MTSKGTRTCFYRALCAALLALIWLAGCGGDIGPAPQPPAVMADAASAGDAAPARDARSPIIAAPHTRCPRWPGLDFVCEDVSNPNAAHAYQCEIDDWQIGPFGTHDCQHVLNVTNGSVWCCPS